MKGWPVSKIPKRVSVRGVLTIDARRFRSQERNRQDASDRLAQLIERASVKPKPRKKTRPSAAAQERRLEAKTRGAQTFTTIAIAR